MLFQRLYNWIKYKTLPPSILFKNRLFIERDSKHKRIFNNFGLVFRNSKWTNHETYNIKTQFRLSFYKYIALFLIVLLFFLLLFNFKKYYICLYFFNCISLIFWLSLDALDYYFSFIIWMLTVTSSLFFNILYSYFFFNNFSETKNIKKIFSHKFFTGNAIINNVKIVEPAFSKHDFNWIFYFWLNNNTEANTCFLENIFNRESPKIIWDSYHNYFIKLYKITHLCAFSSSNHSTYAKNLNFVKLSNIFFKGNKNLLSFNMLSDPRTPYFNVFLHYLLKNYNNYFQLTLENQKIGFNFLPRHDFDLYSIHAQCDTYGFLIKNKNGPFFFKNFSFENFSFLSTNYIEFLNLSKNLSDQLASAKWNRWLYRYSILHRKIIKNAHKITLVKRLLNSGFYNINLFEKNLWASENFLKYDTNFNILNSFFNAHYPIIFSGSEKWNTSNLFFKNNSRNAEFLNLYENSFFWLNKRFYFFNPTSANLIKNRKYLNVSFNKNAPLYKNFNSYSLILSFLLKPFFNHNLNYTNYVKTRTDFSADSAITLNKNHYLLKDVFLSFGENDVLSKDDLSVLYWICSKSFLKKNINVFNCLAYSTIDCEFATFYRINSSHNQDNFYDFDKEFNYFTDLYFYGICSTKR